MNEKPITKHTPGPWKVSQRDAEGNLTTPAIFANGVIVAVVSELPGGYEANANLIAAAPELLEALKALVKSNEEHNEAVSEVIGKPTGWHDGYLNDARDAILKAEGGAE